MHVWRAKSCFCAQKKSLCIHFAFRFSLKHEALFAHISYYRYGFRFDGDSTHLYILNLAVADLLCCLVLALLHSLTFLFRSSR